MSPFIQRCPMHMGTDKLQGSSVNRTCHSAFFCPHSKASWPCISLTLNVSKHIVRPWFSLLVPTGRGLKLEFELHLSVYSSSCRMEFAMAILLHCFITSTFILCGEHTRNWLHLCKLLQLPREKRKTPPPLSPPP